MASRCGAERMVLRSARARPEETALMRTLSSETFGGRVGEERKVWILWRAAALLEGVTLSSRS
jgi:hypothetical protein